MGLSKDEERGRRLALLAKRLTRRGARLVETQADPRHKEKRHAPL